MPIAKPVENVQEEKIIFDFSSEANNIKVNEPIEFVSVTELNENGVIKYSLEEYMEVENDLLTSKPVANINEPVEESLNFTMKVTDVSKPTYATHTEDISPMEMTIEETLKIRADERRRKLKDFNYKFHNNPSRIEELEKEPAYKRVGLDLTENNNYNNNSRMSLGMDSNDDVQLRSNNSFLHDNVD